LRSLTEDFFIVNFFDLLLVLRQTPVCFNKQFGACWAAFWEWVRRKYPVKVEENLTQNLVKLQVLGLCECFKTGFCTFMVYMLGKPSKI